MMFGRSHFKKWMLGLLSTFLVAGSVACSSTSTNPASSDSSSKTTESSVGTPKATNEQGSNDPQAGGVLRLARHQDVSSFDPIVPTDNMSIWTILNLYDQLVRLNADGSDIEPGLATDWSISDDGKSYTFNLRPGVKFHNGMPVTAQDVKFSLERAKSDESNWNWMYTAFDSVEVKSNSQVVIHLNTPYIPLLSTLALFSSSIVPEQIVKENGKDYLTNNPVGSGPFMLDNWQRGQKVVLKKNPEYWQAGKPYLDGVEFLQVPEDTAKIFKLQAKELDIASNVPFNTLEQLKTDPALEVIVAPFARVDMIPINTTKEPFNDVKIRQAMNYAVNKKDIIQAVLMGQGEPAASYLPKVMYFNDQLKGYPYDLEKAKQLMSESSRPNGFKTTLTINAGNEINSQVAVIVKEQLKEIGIDIEIQQLEPGVVDELLASMKYDLITTYYSSDIIDPDEITMFGAVSTGGTNAYYTGYKNPRLDELAMQAQGENDADKRKEMYMEMQKMFSEDAPHVFLFHVPSSYVTQKNVQGFTLSPMGSYRLEEVWLKP
ncbi:ABC transporter substrate-binding protein [Ammoniphilus sp. CFH 90114]|uniref:ABC transporter substrate-binding protein n=1 Tax=Ammoniphilus sp. CFH 90114 TaxID=2493665 RepID=UPI0013E98E6A|nr:ABC transporter substrate-binding protein [Ammoniphilus sp. CFH 90114]